MVKVNSNEGIYISLTHLLLHLINSTTLKFTILLICFLTIPMSCKSQEEYTIKEQFHKCLEGAEKIIFTYEDGRKGYSHNVKSDCIHGSKLPDISISDLHGEDLNLLDLKGEISVLHFWFLQCKPCLEEIPELNKLRESFAHTDINFLAFSKDSAEAVLKFLDLKEFNFRLIPDCEKLINSELKFFHGYPSTIVTDRNNKVLKVYGKLSDKVIQDLTNLLSEAYTK